MKEDPNQVVGSVRAAKGGLRPPTLREIGAGPFAQRFLAELRDHITWLESPYASYREEAIRNSLSARCFPEALLGAAKGGLYGAPEGALRLLEETRQKVALLDEVWRSLALRAAYAQALWRNPFTDADYHANLAAYRRQYHAALAARKQAK